MVNQTDEALDGVFNALADPTRRSILSGLATGEATVKEIAAPFSMSLPAVSKHLKVLEKAGLVDREVVGRTHTMRIRPAGLRTAAEWVEHYRAFWDVQLDRLEAFLDESGSDDQRTSGEVDEEHES